MQAGTQVDVSFTGTPVFTTSNLGITEGGTSFVGFYNEGSLGSRTHREDAAAVYPELNLGSFGRILIGGYSTNSSGYDDGITMTPPGSTRAIGFNFGSYADNNGNGLFQGNSTSSTQFLIRVFEGAGNMTGEYTVSGLDRPNLGFFGVATSGDITGVQLFVQNFAGPGNRTYALIDNFSSGGTTLSGGGGGGGGEPTGGDVPEPGTYALFGAGLLAIALIRKKL